MTPIPTHFSRLAPVAGFLLLLGGVAAAQGFDARPRIERVRMAAGNYLDLDSGLILTSPTQRRAVADLKFDRDGVGFVVHAVHGGVAAGAGDEKPDEDAEWSKAGLRIDSNQQVSRGRWFVKTNRMTIALVEVVIVQPYATPSALISWVRMPETNAVFVPAPTGLDADWKGKTIELTWDATPGKFLVEHVHTGSQPVLEVVAEPRFRLQAKTETALHRVLVRRVLEDGGFGLPAALTLRAKHAPAKRFVIELPESWNRKNGGLDLVNGALQAEAPDVVLYAYGAYSPRGGILRVGAGERAFHALTELPDRGYLPVYGRLDHGDVFAVRLADGRFAKIMIEKGKGHILQQLRVHGVFLESGRRRLLSRVANASASLKGTDLIELRWDPVPGAERYYVRQPGSKKMLATTKTRAVYGPMPRNRFHALEIMARDARGETSDPAVVLAHTFGQGYRVGTFTMNASGRRGFSLSEEASARAGDDDVELVITNSAGGASSLAFSGPYGIAASKGAEFGAFPDDGTTFGKEHDTDDREPASEVFWVRTRKGEIASVRIRSRAYPRVEFAYVLRKGKR